jgi:hypothetical protein
VQVADGTATPITADASAKRQPVSTYWRGTSVEATLDTTLANTPYTVEETGAGYLVYRPITKAFMDVELKQALTEFARATGVEITVRPHIKRSIYAVIQNVTIAQALGILMPSTPYVAKVTGGGYEVAHWSTLIDTSVRDAKTDELAKRITQIEIDRVADAQKFAPNHPEIVQTKQLLAAYEKQLAAKR